MKTEEITNCRDLAAFCKLKRGDLIAYLHGFGIVETDTGGLIRNCNMARLREETCRVMKLERLKQ